MSRPAYRALMFRSEALSKLYGNAVTRLSQRVVQGTRPGWRDGWRRTSLLRRRPR